MLSSKKAIVAIFAVVLMVLSVGIVVIPNSVAVTNGPELVLDSDTEQDQVQDVLGPKATWDKATTTLTLSGVNHSTEEGVGSAIKSDVDNLTIKVIGNNKIEARNSPSDNNLCALYSPSGNITITGDGADSSTLELIAGQNGGEGGYSHGLKCSSGNLTIKGLTLKATSNSAPDTSSGIMCYYGDITITDSIVIAEGNGTSGVSTNGMELDKGVTISNSKITATGTDYGLVTESPENYHPDISSSDVTIVGSKSALSNGVYTDEIQCIEILAGADEKSLNVITDNPIPTSFKMVVIKGMESPRHNVTYELNGGSGTAPTQDPVAEGDSFTVAGIGSVTKTGYTFGGWTIDGDTSGKVYKAGDTVKMGTSDITFKAVWEGSPTPSSGDNNGMVFAVLVVVVILVILGLAWFSRDD